MPPRNALGPDNRLFPDSGPTLADAWSHNASAYSDWLAQQRASGVQAGMIDPATGWPTSNALVDAARQYGGAMLASTSAPGGNVAGKALSSLDDVRGAWDASGIAHHMAEKDGLITVSKVVVPKEMRGQGIGTQAMQALNDYADATGQRVAVTPDTSFGASSLGRLVDFYKGLGFSPNKGRSRDFSTQESMIRNPTASGTDPSQ